MAVIELSRCESLLGRDVMTRLEALKVVVFGVGGVGGWCAEALIRSGVKKLTIVDDDIVAPSNINRQCAALASTMGEKKVEAMKARLKAINPDAEIEALAVRYPDGFKHTLNDYDFIVDAIDSVDCKAELILSATELGVSIVSSMGAARRLDPTQVEIKRFDKIEGDGLARALRQRFKKLERFPKHKFYCANSKETPLDSSGVTSLPSYMPVTSAFGMALAAKVISSVKEEIK